jgi:integrase
MDKPLYIPPAKRLKGLGLTVYCYKCLTNVSDVCKETDAPLPKCPFGNKHAFKVYAHLPGTENKRKTKKLETHDVNEAIKQAIEFQQEVKENKFIESDKKATVSKEVSANQNIPQLLVEAFARDIGRLYNEGVPEHRIEERSVEHIKDVERAFRLVADCLNKNGENISKLRMDHLNDKMVGMIYKYMKEVKGFKNRTINKYLSHLTSFITRHNQEYNTTVQNFFETVPRKSIIPKPQMISKDEYTDLLKIITPENGIKEYDRGVKPLRNYYFEYLIPGIKLGLYTGRRREEICNMRFSDIFTSPDGRMYIKAEDLKVNRIKNLTEEDKKYNYVPVTPQLKKLLLELGYEKYKGTDNFILAPELNHNRTKYLMDNLSRGFGHYYEKLGTGRKLTFKSLRKTYITNLTLYMGDNARLVIGHSSNAVRDKNYIVKEEIAKQAVNYEVFSEEHDRKTELEQIRNNSKQNQIEMEVEK